MENKINCLYCGKEVIKNTANSYMELLDKNLVEKIHKMSERIQNKVYKGGNKDMKIATSTKEKGEAFEKVHIPEELYEAELKEVKDVSEGQYGPRVVWVYKILEKNVELGFLCYKNTATKENKIGKTMIAHGVELNDAEFELESLYGSKVRVLVEDYEYEDTGVKKTASSISKVKPFVETDKVKVPTAE